MAFPAFAQTPPNADGQHVEEIVVTAQRREQNLQKVPIAVTALSENTLRVNRYQNVENLNAIAPGLSVRPSQGGAQLPNFSMRGVFNSAPIGADQGVALYVDGVYQDVAVGSAFDIADVERIEVLRGPQGTLFGRNSIGGAVSIITKEPTGEFGVRQELSYGNYDQVRSKTRVSLPAWGPFAATVTYLHNSRRGDVRNLGGGTTWDYGPATNGALGKLKSPDYLGDQDVNAVSAAVSFKPSSDLDMIYRFNWMENHYSGEATGVQAIENNAEGQLIQGLVLTQPDPSLLTPISRKRPDAVNNAFAIPGYQRTQSHSLTSTYHLSDTITFKNILAYRKLFLRSGAQLDGLGGLVDTLPLPYSQALHLTPGAPFIGIASDTSTSESQWSEEFQLSIRNKWFLLTAGYLHFDSKVNSGAAAAGVTTEPQFQTIPGYVMPGVGSLPTNLHVQSDAAYFQNEIHLTDKLDLVMGARITADRKFGTDNSAPGDPFPIRYRGSQPTYLAGLNYQLSSSIFTYAKFSTGYISGGELGSFDFKPTTAKSWEAGVKADWLDHRLRTNLAVFDVKYKALPFVDTGSRYGVPAAVVILTAGDARDYGVEFEGTAIPFDGLTLQGNFAYNHFKYSSVNPILLPFVGGSAAGFPPIYRPDWTADASIQYETKPVLDGGRLLFRLQGTYTSSQNTVLGTDLAFRRATEVPATALLNGRIALTGFDLAGSKAEVALWAQNLTNNRSILLAADYVYVSPTLYQPARTFGVDFNFEF